MTNQEEQSIIKIAGEDYSYWDIPTAIRVRDEMPKPSDPNAPYHLEDAIIRSYFGFKG